MNKSKSTPSRPETPKRFQDMTAEELAAETAQYDAEMLDPVGQTKPLSRQMRARHERVMRKAPRHPGGRPRVGKGAVMVGVSIERGLLEDADAYSKKSGISRSELVATGLRMAMKRKNKSAG